MAFEPFAKKELSVFLKNLLSTSLALLEKKEKKVWLVLAVVVIGCLYYLMFLKPKFQTALDLKRQEQTFKKQWQAIAAQYPDLANAQAELKRTKEKIGEIKFKMQDIESKLLRESQLSLFLTELIKCAQGLSIDFQSVKQSEETDKTGFLALLIEMKFESNYEDMLNYLQRVEGISPFVKVEDIEVTPSKADPSGITATVLKLSALMSSDPNSNTPLSTVCSADMGTKLSVNHNPLAPIMKKAETVGWKKRGVKLEGITFSASGPNSSAIINDAVVKEGDELNGNTVEKILPDAVILNDGKESFRVNMER